MKKFKLKLKKGLLNIYILLIFVLVYGIIIAIYPKEERFEYEFQKGTPWQHEDLIASYDFPVYKTEEELKNEKDSVKRDFLPYFTKDSSVINEVKNKAGKRFDEYWKKYWAEKQIKNILNSLNSINKPVRLKNKFRDILINSVDSVYKHGVINVDSTGESSEFRLLRGETSYDYSFEDVYTKKEAENVLEKKFKEKAFSINQDSLISRFITDFKADNLIIPDLIYDKLTNKNILNKKIDNISLTRGIVQEGELIIQQGGIIDHETYKILQSMKKEQKESSGRTTKGLLIMGIILLYSATALALFLFLKTFKPKMLDSVKKITFVLLQVLWVMVLTIALVRFTDFSIYIVPFAIIPMVLNTFYDSRTALFVHIIIILMAGFHAPNGFEFVLIQMFAGIVAVFGLNNIQKRKQLFVTSFYVLLVYAVTYFSLQMLYGNGIDQLVWTDFAWFGGNAVLLLFTFPLIYAYEKLFGFVSDVTLMELGDTNNPLLKRLAEKAPGTFQHSLQVGNLAESVCREIGGNPLLVRTGALYHDIGKSKEPYYFIENQSGQNPHDQLDYDKSAEVIISHVKKGEKMAKKAGLPEQIIDFIVTHHGTTRTEYFYRSFVNEHPDKEVDESKFRYPGPSPVNIETAILMMADAVEASTRTLKNYNYENIRTMISNVIDSQRNSDQFEDVDITFKMITKAKRIFTDKIMSIYHARIEYPEVNKAKSGKSSKQ